MGARLGDTTPLISRIVPVRLSARDPFQHPVGRWHVVVGVARTRLGSSASGCAVYGSGRIALRVDYGSIFPLAGSAASAEEGHRVTIVMGVSTLKPN